MLQENIHKVQLMKPAISKGSFKPTKKIFYLTSPAKESSKKFFLISVAQSKMVSHAFVYNAADINKIVTIH